MSDEVISAMAKAEELVFEQLDLLKRRVPDFLLQYITDNCEVERDGDHDHIIWG